jgi:hypothetical protein
MSSWSFHNTRDNNAPLPLKGRTLTTTLIFPPPDAMVQAVQASLLRKKLSAVYGLSTARDGYVRHARSSGGLMARRRGRRRSVSVKEAALLVLLSSRCPRDYKREPLPSAAVQRTDPCSLHVRDPRIPGIFETFPTSETAALSKTNTTSLVIPALAASSFRSLRSERAARAGDETSRPPNPKFLL